MMHHEITKINNYSLSYCEFGDINSTHTLLILHGWGLSSKAYLKLGELISQKNYHVFVIDIPGFGNSTAPIEKWDYEEFADHIFDFITKVIKKKVIILGHSLGGGIGVALASKYCSQVDRLLLVDSTGIPINQPIIVIGAKKMMEMWWQLLTIHGFLPSLKMIIAFLMNVVKNPLAMYNALELPNNQDLTYMFSNMKLPISIYWAKRDMMISYEIGQRISILTHSPITFAPDYMYHDWCITHPKIFIEILNL